MSNEPSPESASNDKPRESDTRKVPGDTGFFPVADGDEGAEEAATRVVHRGTQDEDELAETTLEPPREEPAPAAPSPAAPAPEPAQLPPTTSPGERTLSLQDTPPPAPMTRATRPRNLARDVLPPGFTPGPVKPVLDASRLAQAQWGAKRLEQRLQVLDLVRAELVGQRSDYAPSLASSIGRPMVETLYGEYLPVLELLRSLPDSTSPWLVERHARGTPAWAEGAGVSMRMMPWGVVVLFTPSDAPFALPMTLAIEALAAGNSVLLCPGERNARITELMRRIFARARMPQDLVLIMGGGWPERRAILDSGPDLVLFDGDLSQAEEAARAGAEHGFAVRVARPTKDMLVVCGDAAIDHAVSAALWAAFAGGGFARGRAERIVVESRIYDEFRMKFLDGLRNINSHHAQLANIGESLNPQRFQKLLTDAAGLGAYITWPAGEQPGRWIHWKGGVIEGLPDRALASRERIEGPACVLYRAEDIAEEARRLNQLSRAGTISVLGEPRPAQRAALEALPVARLAFGEPMLNGGCFDGAAVDGLNMPSPGAGAYWMLRPQVVVRSSKVNHRVGWFPYTEDKADAMLEAIEAAYHTEWKQRLQAELRLGMNASRRRLLRGKE